MTRTEVINASIHGIAALVGIVGLVLLILAAKTPWMLTSFLIYGISLVLLFLSSTLYHGFGQKSNFLRTLDHGSIYLLIAGTYTPFTLISLRGALGWTLFGVIWGIALTGISLSTVFKDKYPNIETAAYILMGWLSLIALVKLYFALGIIGFLLLLLGGVVYTSGVYFYKREGLRYNHAVWHTFVVAAAFCHYLAIYFFVTPK